MADTKVEMSEIDLVERVFLRIASADTDGQFETVLGNFLTAVLLKLGSGDTAVRSKVLEVLSHVNKRLKTRPKLQLPLQSIVTQYQSHDVSPFVQNFSMIYLRMGYERLDVPSRVAYLPQILACLPNKPASHQDIILHLMITVLEDTTIPESISQRAEMFKSLTEKTTLTNCLSLIQMFLVLPYNMSDILDQLPPPPCLSESNLTRLKTDVNLSAESIEKGKLGIIKLLACDLFCNEDILAYLVVASADTRHTVGDRAEHTIKKLSSATDWEGKKVVDKLFQLYQGTVVAKGSKNQSLTKEGCITPAVVRQKMKIFPFLLKSRTAANASPMLCVQVIYDGLFGKETNSKLKMYAMEFCHHVCQHGSERNVKMIGLLLFQALSKVAFSPDEETKLVSRAFTAIGRLARREPTLFNKDISIVQRLFEKLDVESNELRLAILEAISMVGPAYRNLSLSDANLMEILILSNIEKDLAHVRLASLQLANTVFKSDHVPSRYACLLLTNDRKDDVRDEALKGLGMKSSHALPEDQEETTVLLPEFDAIVNFFWEKMKPRVSDSHPERQIFTGTTFLKMLQYLKRCLHHSAAVTNEEEVSDAFLPKVSVFLNSLPATHDGQLTLENYVCVLKQALSPVAGSFLHAEALGCLLEIAASFYGTNLNFTALTTSQVKVYMKSSNEETRDSAARLLGMTMTAKPVEEVKAICVDLIKNLDNDIPEVQHGNILACGYCFATLIKPGLSKETRPECIDDLLNVAMNKLGEKLSSSNTQVSSSVCTAIGELGRGSPLPIRDGTSDDSKEPTASSQCSKLYITERLLALFSKSKDAKVQESAALAIGFLCVGDPLFPHKKIIIDALFESAKDRQTELNFTVGEALSCVAAGALSSRAKDKWSIAQVSRQDSSPVDTNQLNEIVDRIERDHVPSTAPYIRQAAAIWLLSLVKFIGKQDVLLDQMKRIQSLFIALLADSDEIAQEVASRGLSLVYDMVEEETKAGLVSLLVDRLMSGNRPKRKIDENTELFKGGSLGASPDGAKLSTYKEICSLATSLNRPDLVYKFMNLANHNAMWNSKKGAAFGFLGIATRAKEQLRPFLPKIIPQLYRYQYDPNPGVQQAMRNIWTAVAPSGKRTFDEYTEEIMKDLIGNLTNPVWRIRESSCLAVNDLIKVCSTDDLIERLPELWEILFKVLDDIKESVRKAATAASKTLSRITCRLCDVNQSSKSEQALAKALPVLVDVGIPSRVADVRAISLDTMVKVSKNAGKYLKPHIPKLVVPLLESLSGLEPQQLNTLSLQLGNSAEARDKLDLIRISASKSSPMMEAINSCVLQIDCGVLELLVPRLVDLLKHGIGLGTKAGCCALVNSLSMQCRNDLTPFAGKLLSALLSGLGDHNAAIRKSYANAIGQLAMYSKQSSIENLIVKLKTWYLEKNDETRLRESCCWTLQAISRHSPDALKAHSALVIPFVFVAMHEEEAKDPTEVNLKPIWDDVWNNTAPGMVSGIRLYLAEIMETVHPVLFSSSWALKAQGARAMAAVARSLGASLSRDHLNRIIKLLSESLPGRTWKGKEQIVLALAIVFVKCKDLIMKVQDEAATTTVNKAVDDLLKECAKSDPVYKQAAITSLSNVVAAYGVDKFAGIWHILLPILKPKEKSKDKSDKDEDDDDDADAYSSDDFLLVCYDAVGSCWPAVASTQGEFGEQVSCVLVSNIEKRTWRIRLSILKSIEHFNNKLKLSELQSVDATFISPYVKRATAIVGSCLQTAPQVILQVRCLECLASFFSLIEGHASLEESLDVDQLHSVVKIRSMSSSPDVARLAATMLPGLARGLEQQTKNDDDMLPASPAADE